MAVRRRRIGWRVGLIVVLGLSALSATQTAQAAPIASGAIPNNYIANYQARNSYCPSIHRPRLRRWVSWQTYVAGRAGSWWYTGASSKRLCKLARDTATKNLSRSASPGWPGRAFPIGNLGSYVDGGQELPMRGAPRGWRCFDLPSTWGLNAADLAAGAGEALSEGAFGAAQGPVNPFHYCVSRKAKRNQNDQWVGGDFFFWGPMILECDLRLSIIGIPDPDNPGIDKSPDFGSVVGSQGNGYYNVSSC